MNSLRCAQLPCQARKPQVPLHVVESDPHWISNIACVCRHVEDMIGNSARWSAKVRVEGCLSACYRRPFTLSKFIFI
jgi:hypothetical protein